MLSEISNGAAGDNGTNANAQSQEPTGLVGGADHSSRNENGSRPEYPEVIPNKSASDDTGSGSNQSQRTAYDVQVDSGQPNVQDTLSSFSQHRRKEGRRQKKTRALSRMNREELLESRDWRLVRMK
ncbi:hypothetical protein V5799_030332 [Amblyomma americanum]|uniref:Uncharacterized protein n=1 Tax=Amblyomma americanum TaxID=6943 RepID=A0AAQ4ENG0_AMBAM